MNSVYIPSHPELFRVQWKDGNYASCLHAQRSFSAGEIITRLQGLTKGPKRYSSVQCGPEEDDHVELHSDLLYLNHSCDPNIILDLSSKNADDWHVRAAKDIQAHETLTFFYPSTEWKMDQPFACECRSPRCLRDIHGACSLSRAEIECRGFMSPWIGSLLQKRDTVDARENHQSVS